MPLIRPLHGRISQTFRISTPIPAASITPEKMSRPSPNKNWHPLRPFGPTDFRAADLLVVGRLIGVSCSPCSALVTAVPAVGRYVMVKKDSTTVVVFPVHFGGVEESVRHVRRTDVGHRVEPEMLQVLALARYEAGDGALPLPHDPRQVHTCAMKVCDLTAAALAAAPLPASRSLFRIQASTSPRPA
jgi:hypothetical protein